MKNLLWIRTLFAIAALYDGVLGAVFLVAPGWVYELFEVTPPNHWGYVQFPAALLLIFAVMFLMIASRPVANRGLIPYGIGLKAAYCLVATWHWIGSDIPGMWKPFVVLDLLMAVLFAYAYVVLGSSARRG